MKKVILVSGIALAGFGLYRYFKYQVEQALNYDYKIKNFEILGNEGSKVKVRATVSISNKSNFEITVKAFDLKLYFKNILFANTISNTDTKIKPNASFNIIADGVIDLAQIKMAVVPFLADVANKKPIDVTVDGFVKVVFLNIPSTITFNKEQFNYSMDLLKEYHLDEKWENFKINHPKIINFLGIKP